jgi:putative hemolysin
MLYLQISIVLFLILANGLLAMSELAVVSSRRSRLKIMIDRNVYGARQALALASDPGRFLSTVQIGITLVGIVSGAFSGATLGLRLSEWLAGLGLPRGIADPAGVGFVVAIITYASLIVGELVPKQVALRNPERVAARVAPAMTILARIAAPLVWLLDISGRGVLRLIGQSERAASGVTDEEIKAIVAEAESAGVIETDERKMISGVMRLGDRPVRGVLTPRTDVDWINLSDDPDTIRTAIMRTQHSRLPVGEDADTMIGVVQTRELLRAMLTGDLPDVRRHVRPAPIVHDSVDAIDILPILRDAAVPMALVHDEYGHFEGIITPADLMEVVLGVFKGEVGGGEAGAVQRDDGSWLLAGWLAADEMAEHLGIALPPERSYQTAAGFVLAHLHRLPEVGESIVSNGWRFEVVDLDGRRIDQVLATRIAHRHERLL